MKKTKATYTLIILLSLLCLVITIYTLQSPTEAIPDQGGVGNVSDSLNRAVGMIGEQLRQKVSP